MTERLVSPTGRRIARVAELGATGATQLRALGWRDYAGPAQATYDATHSARSGWVVPGTDPALDAERLRVTGTALLGQTRR